MSAWALIGDDPTLAVRLGLTARELQVLAAVARGETNEEIGRGLGISSRTVQKHLEHVFKKLGVSTRTAAVVRAAELAGRGD